MTRRNPRRGPTGPGECVLQRHGGRKGDKSVGKRESRERRAYSYKVETTTAGRLSWECDACEGHRKEGTGPFLRESA